MKNKCPHEYAKEILKTDLNSKIYETAGIMSAVLKYYFGRSHIPHNADKYENHVWVKWAGTSPWMDNYNWIYKYFQSLCNRFEEEFGEEHFIWTKYAQVYYEPIQSYKSSLDIKKIRDPEKYWDGAGEEENTSDWKITQRTKTITCGNFKILIEEFDNKEYRIDSFFSRSQNINLPDHRYLTAMEEFGCVIHSEGLEDLKEKVISYSQTLIDDLQLLINEIKKLKE